MGWKEHIRELVLVVGCRVHHQHIVKHVLASIVESIAVTFVELQEGLMETSSHVCMKMCPLFLLLE